MISDGGVFKSRSVTRNWEHEDTIPTTGGRAGVADWEDDVINTHQEAPEAGSTGNDRGSVDNTNV